MDRKRKNTDNANHNQNKKQKTYNIWSNMVSGSAIRNYMIDDPIVDWLKYYNINDFCSNIKLAKGCIIKPAKGCVINIKTTSNNSNHDSNHHTTFIMSQGLEFEKLVVNKLREEYDVIQIGENYTDNLDYNKHLETVELMKQGIEIIYQGILHDYNNNIFGTPDLLVRSDIMNKLFNINIENECNNNLLGTKFYYVVVDIKHSTLYFNSKRNYLKNIGNVIAYKGQLNIYNRLLMSVQGYFPRYGFVLGKRHIFTKNNVTIINDDYLDSLAFIDFEDSDKSVHDKVTKAIEWIINMRTNGHTWKILPKPSVNELYPNMKANKDTPYWKIKSDIADKIGEITNIWWCGVGKRELAHKKNVYSWRDRKFSSEILNITNKHISTTIDNIVNINRSRYDLIRSDDLIKNDYWREDNNILELYIDFEVINSNVGQLSEDLENIDNSMIFMIGLGYKSKVNKFKFKSFILEENNNASELKMIQDMWDYIDNLLSINKDKTEVRFIHWSNAEINFYNRFAKKHKILNVPLLSYNNSFDLYKLFVENNIVVKGALNFSLKTIANAMYNHNMIETTWGNSNTTNGLQAMMSAFNVYNSHKGSIKNNKIMKDISKYNEIDCKVMFDILTYLRNNY